MSANLLDGVTPELVNGTTEEGGVWHNAGRTIADGHDDWLVWDLAGQSALATNQAYHVGLSVRGASANSWSLRTSIGYRDAAGNVNWVTSDPLPIGTSWTRDEATITVPSGMKPSAFYVAAYGVCTETWMAAPTLSLGSPVVMASASVTIAWSAGIVATVRYYQLAAPTAATPTAPTTSDDLGSWSETEPAADVTKVLWTCERTVYADGTESWSKASKSTSYEAAKDAKSTANAANSTANTAKSTADTAKSTAETAKDTADDAYSRTLRVQVSSAPADAAGDTSTLTATVWRGGELLSDEAVARMGLVAWYVGGSRVATGYTYSCAAGTATECRLEA